MPELDNELCGTCHGTGGTNDEPCKPCDGLGYLERRDKPEKARKGKEE